jgi:hypothetical protein
MIRRFAYARFSEARAAHWLLLLAADRVDSMGSSVRSFASRRPDNPITETGVLAEFSHSGWTSRVNRKRADVKHHAVDPMIVATPWIARAAVAFLAVRGVARVLRKPR